MTISDYIFLFSGFGIGYGFGWWECNKLLKKSISEHEKTLKFAERLIAEGKRKGE